MPSKPLYIIWNFNNQVVAEYMIFIYSVNTLKNKEREDINVIITGPACKIITGNENMQKRIKEFVKAGGSVTICQASAEEYGVLDALQNVKILNFIDKFDMEELAKKKNIDIMKY